MKKQARIHFGVVRRVWRAEAPWFWQRAFPSAGGDLPDGSGGLPHDKKIPAKGGRCLCCARLRSFWLLRSRVPQAARAAGPARAGALAALSGKQRRRMRRFLCPTIRSERCSPSCRHHRLEMIRQMAHCYADVLLFLLLADPAFISGRRSGRQRACWNWLRL